MNDSKPRKGSYRCQTLQMHKYYTFLCSLYELLTFFDILVHFLIIAFYEIQVLADTVIICINLVVAQLDRKIMWELNLIIYKARLVNNPNIFGTHF